jgi:hypothetical protein
MSYNLIQNPEIIARLARFLGMRQAHVTPSLQEGLQAVVIVGDARDIAQESGPQGPALRKYAVAPWSSVALNFENFHSFYNATLDRTFRIKRIAITTPATVPWRLRLGWRNAQLGGALLQYGYLDATTGKQFEQSIVGYVGSIATGGNVITQVFYEHQLSNYCPLIWEDTGIVVPPGKGLAWQSLGVGDQRNEMSSSILLEEIS